MCYQHITSYLRWLAIIEDFSVLRNVLLNNFFVLRKGKNYVLILVNLNIGVYSILDAACWISAGMDEVSLYTFLCFRYKFLDINTGEDKIIHIFIHNCFQSNSKSVLYMKPQPVDVD